MTVPLALIGAGRIGTFHAEALAGSEVARFAVVVEPTGVRPPAIGPEVPVVRSVAELADHQVDAALVAVPSRLHATVIPEVLDHGLPVLSEKPCGLVAEDTERVAAAAERIGVPVRVAYWRRVVPALVDLRAELAAGALGAVASVISHQWDEAPPPASFRDPASSGGIVVDCGVHDLDTVQWLTGQQLRGLRGYAADTVSVPAVPGDPESAALVGQLSGGGTAVVTLGRRHPGGERQVVEVIGTRAVRRVTLVEASDTRPIAAAFRTLVEDHATTLGGPGTRTASLEEAAALLRLAAEGTTRLEPVQPW